MSFGFRGSFLVSREGLTLSSNLGMPPRSWFASSSSLKGEISEGFLNDSEGWSLSGFYWSIFAPWLGSPLLPSTPFGWAILSGFWASLSKSLAFWRTGKEFGVSFCKSPSLPSGDLDEGLVGFWMFLSESWRLSISDWGWPYFVFKGVDWSLLVFWLPWSKLFGFPGS